VFEALKNIFGNERKSKSTAKSRLHFVLVQDRAGLTNEEMGSFRKEILTVMEKYFVIDKQAFDIQYQRESDTTTLVINSPLVVNRKEAIGGAVGARNGHRNKNKKGKKAAANAH
jgi:cell division topological specificity factor